MRRLKNFLNKKRVETHFKRSGEGTRLDGQSSSSAPSGNQPEQAKDAAREAALKRFEQSQTKADPNKSIRMAAKRDMEREKAAEEEARKEREAEEARNNQSFGNTSAITSETDDEPENPENFQVYFKCEILEDENFSARKPELLKAIEAELMGVFDKSDDDEEKVQAAIILLHMFNPESTRTPAIDMLYTICSNILQHPDDPKYKRLNKDGKAVQGKLAPAKGGLEFLKAIGFEEKVIDGETKLVFTRDSDAHLVEHMEELKQGRTIPIKVSRELKLFAMKNGEKPKVPELSKDFFNLSIAEVRAEQQAKTTQLERMFTLRTKEMRMKDEGLLNKDRYKYTLIRVRLPNNVIIQGVFGAGEPFSAVRIFVASVLSPAVAASEFTLHDAIGQKTNDESISLGALNLAPTALLHLDFAETPSESEELIHEEYLHLLQQQE